MDDFDSKPSGRPSMDAMASEFARILRQQLEQVSSDPKQARALVYELARIRLSEQFVEDNAGDTRRALHALETAIQDVEASLVGQDQGKAVGPSPQATASNVVAPIARPGWQRSRYRRMPSLASIGLGRRLALVVVVLLLAGSAALYWRQGSAYIVALRHPDVPQQPVAPPEPPKVIEPPQAVANVAPPPPVEPALPLPMTFGVYALSDGQLQELKAVPGKVPDHRVAISAAIATPSATTLGTGDVKFIVFRPDGGGDASETEVRVVAKVSRTMGVDATGKAAMMKSGDAWVIRSMSFPYKAGPVEDQPRMLLLQSEQDGFELTPGRYVVVVKGMGYDFTVAGTVTDPNQCVERVNATNGAFYSPCPNR